MITSTTRKLTRFQYAATLLGALAFVALAPATANAQPVNGAGDGGCHYTDKDGYDIPIDEGQSVLVDGKTVTCTGGTITVSKTTKGGLGSVRPGQVGSVLSPVNEAPKKPVLTENVAIFQAQP
jgi:hypothetical protein